MVFVKICGLTNGADAHAAARAGADYLGFIFYPPSKRSITTAVAKSIVETLRQGERCPVLVGVFVNESAERMAAVLDEVGLDLAQLSGDEVPRLVGDAASPIYGRSYKAIKPSSVEEAEAEAEWFTAPLLNPHSSIVNRQPGLMIEGYHPTLHGGTGETGDWEIAARLAHQQERLMLAGGLTPDNVADAVRQVRPFAVDVASGVEAAPGQKDHDKVRRFIDHAKNG